MASTPAAIAWSARPRDTIVRELIPIRKLLPWSSGPGWGSRSTIPCEARRRINGGPCTTTEAPAPTTTRHQQEPPRFTAKRSGVEGRAGWLAPNRLLSLRLERHATSRRDGANMTYGSPGSSLAHVRGGGFRGSRLRRASGDAYRLSDSVWLTGLIQLSDSRAGGCAGGHPARRDGE
jgi:hypothetical protein